MPIDWTPFVDFVRRRQSYVLTTHVRPDGDGLGSILALGEALRTLGKSVRLTIASKYPPRYEFLDPERRVEQFVTPGDDWRSADAVVVMDTGTWGQLGVFGPFLASSPAEKFVIDHHRTQDDLGATRLVDTSSESCGRLSFEAIRALGVSLSATAANHLYVAVAMDTGWFRHSNTTAATHTLAAELVAAGARPERLYEELFERNSLGRLKLIGVTLERLQVVEDGRVAYSEIHRGDYETTGAVPQDTEELVNYPRSVTGVEVGLMFYEQPRGGIKVSFRSRERVDVARVAEQFGGGGHRLASGAVLEMPMAEARSRVLQAVRLALPSE